MNKVMINDPRKVKISDFPSKGSPESKIKFLLNYAVLAPSTHNSQPWLFKIKENYCEIYYDKTKLLPQADPKGRDLYISLGCAIENLIIASKYFNVFQGSNYGPFVEENLVAKAYFSFDNNQQVFVREDLEELLSMIPKRINARGLFQDGFVSPEATSSILANIKKEDYLLDKLEINFIERKDKVKEIGSLTKEGIRIAYKNPVFRKEMSKWLRSSFTSDKEGLPGYALKMPATLSFILPIILRFKDLGGFLGKLNEKSISSAPLICIISSMKESPFIWLQVGRLADRLMLEFTKHSYNTSIFVAAIEMGNLYKKLQSIIGTNLVPQFLFAVGKIDSLHKPTPRHNLSEKIIK